MLREGPPDYEKHSQKTEKRSYEMEPPSAHTSEDLPSVKCSTVGRLREAA
jgi:hypothetical protein